MRNTLETRLGVFVALVLIAAAVLLEIQGGFDAFQRGYHLNADFHHVNDLKVGDRVRMAGVEIGKVKDIQLTNDHVRVVMKLHSDATVKTDSTATIKFTGLLGQNFIAIDFGSPSAPKAEPGTNLKTEEQPDL